MDFDFAIQHCSGMDSQTTASDLLAAMLQNDIIDEAKGSKSNNSGRDMLKFVLNINKESAHESSISMMTVPHELMEHILIFLDPKSMLTCKLVNREFNDIIQSSTLLQYTLACKAAGVIDNPQSPFSYAERLEALMKRENAWRKLKPVFDMTISVTHQADSPSQICRTTEGVCFLSDDNLTDLNYCVLTSYPQDNPRWTRIPGHGPALDWSGILVNFGAAIYEHDLIVNMISSDIENQADMQRHSLDLVLLKFSTGEYHPLARLPRIHVQRSPAAIRWVVSRIVGDHIALVVHSDDGTFSDRLFIFDWKTGRKLLKHEARNAYVGLVFLSPELLLVPNCALSKLEVWYLPPHQLNPKPPIQILSLQIPTISPEYSLRTFDCYGEPNPFVQDMPYLPPLPFLSSSDNSIIMIKLLMSSNLRRDVSYNLIVHRRALLDMIQIWTSPSLLEQQEYLPRWMTNEVVVDQIADPENGSIELYAQSKLVSTTPHPRRTHDFPTWATSQTSQTFSASHISDDSGSSSFSSGLSTNMSTSRYTFFQVPWAKWGPPISRWFQINETQARSLNHSNGQRYAFSDHNPLNRRKLMVSVADFNQHNFRRNKEIMARLRNGNNEEEKEEEFDILDHKGVFWEEVHMGLKCVVYRAPDEYDFDVVSMDGERLVGVKLNRDGRRERVKVLYIG